MKPITIFLALLVVLCWVVSPVSAQTNLLVNPGFEQPYGGGYHRNTAQGWLSWVGGGDVDFYPEQYGSVYAGGNSQAILAASGIRDSSPLDVAVYQVAQNVPVGARVKAQAWGSLWMFGVPDPANAGARLRIGIDPNGGINPNDSDVVWGEVNAAQGRVQGQGWILPYTQIAVEAVSTGTAVTVFLRWQQIWGGTEQRAYFDDAALFIVQGGGTAPQPPQSTPADTPAPVPDGAQSTYVVQPGDMLYRIALRLGTTVQAIVAANNIANPNIIHVGTTLIVPGADVPQPQPAPATAVPPDPAAACISPYTVIAGDTLYRIALRCGKTVEVIAAANGITNRNLIYVGQQLVIP